MHFFFTNYKICPYTVGVISKGRYMNPIYIFIAFLVNLNYDWSVYIDRFCTEKETLYTLEMFK